MAATRDLLFTFAAAETVVTDHMRLVIRSSGGAVVLDIALEKGATSYLVTNLPVGTGYTAKLTAYSETDVPDASPPTINFDVTAPGPPGDPTLDDPTFV